jgi:uncharacterized protein (DUF1697 family)
VTLYVALLRAVNVGGRAVAMADLKAMFASLGFADARPVLQSGNIVFAGSAKSGAALEALLEAETEKRFKLRADYLVRTRVEWQAIIADNPFARAAKDDPSHLLVVPLKSTPTKTALAALEAAITGRESVRAKGRTLYIVYPDGIGRSKLTLASIERQLDTRGTGRNWNTVLKLQAMVEALAAAS